MIRWRGIEPFSREIGNLIGKFNELPRHIAKKHLGAAMRRAIRPGVPVLRSMTPPVATRRGRPGKAKKKATRTNYQSTPGSLRRSVTTNAKSYVKGRSGFVMGRVGYRLGFESRKANWVNFGTKGGVRPQSFLERFKLTFRGPASRELANELAAALEAAAKEVKSPKSAAAFQALKARKGF